MERPEARRLKPEIVEKLTRRLERKVGGFAPILLPDMQALQELEEFVQKNGGIVMDFHYTVHPKTHKEGWWDFEKFTFAADLESPLIPKSMDIEQRIANARRIIRENFGDSFDLAESIKIYAEKEKPGIILLKPDLSIFMDEKHKTASRRFWSSLMQSRNTVLEYYGKNGVQILLPLVGENSEDKFKESFFYARDLMSVRGMI